ncbi:U3 small nucleolar RNA-associated protein 15, putative [Hepatocystis sp. ex Piliocolobus tephrosceles]|nr:U3 small nucleolar RNA-associated protein 15, putative [Hepatocystis sp. ex Piliocolobus tephrosceles]
MALFKPITLTRNKNKICDIDQSLIKFNIMTQGYEEGCVIKSISICKEYVALSKNALVIVACVKSGMKRKQQCKENVSKLKFRDSNMLGIGMENGDIDLLGVGLFDIIKKLKGHKSSITDLVFDTDFSKLYSCSRDFTIKIWNIWEGLCKNTLDYHVDNVTSICLFNNNNNNNNNYLISSGYDGYIYFYDNKLEKQTKKLEMDEPIECFTIFNNTYIVLAIKNRIKIYTVNNLEHIKDIYVCTKTIFYLNSFQDYLVAGCLDNTIYVINMFVTKPKEINVLSTIKYCKLLSCVDVYGNILSLGGGNGNWFICLQDEKTNINSKKKDESFFNCYKDTKFSYQSHNISSLVKKFKLNEALMSLIKQDPRATVSLLEYYSKNRMLRIAYVNQWINSTTNEKLSYELSLLLRVIQNEMNVINKFKELKTFTDDLFNNSL